MAMARRRYCRHCRQPLRVTMRVDALYCGPACRAAARRSSIYWMKVIAVDLAAARGLQDRIGRHCPVCGRWFVPGVGVRRDAVYDTPACRTAAWRARRASSPRQPLREAVTESAAVTDAGTPARG
ncbi:hypothetical protein [Streptosporangium canum]|uniref:hypothetical protein n=1 Tax=Streptosporangium canum TaxID=324952 RepID=UPI00379152A8